MQQHSGQWDGLSSVSTKFMRLFDEGARGGNATGFCTLAPNCPSSPQGVEEAASATFYDCFVWFYDEDSHRMAKKVVRLAYLRRSYGERMSKLFHLLVMLIIPDNLICSFPFYAAVVASFL